VNESLNTIILAVVCLFHGACSTPQKHEHRALIRGRIVSAGLKELPAILLPDGRRLPILPPRQFRVGEVVALRAHIAFMKPRKRDPDAQLFGIHFTGGEYVQLDQ
jgi:hypothetical protein